MNLSRSYVKRNPEIQQCDRQHKHKPFRVDPEHVNQDSEHAGGRRDAPWFRPLPPGARAPLPSSSSPCNSVCISKQRTRCLLFSGINWNDYTRDLVPSREIKKTRSKASFSSGGGVGGGGGGVRSWDSSPLSSSHTDSVHCTGGGAALGFWSGGGVPQLKWDAEL